MLEYVVMGAEKEKLKGPKKLERHFKGVSNHRRIQILLYVAKREEPTLDDITGHIKCNFRTASAHTQKLVGAGLLEKRYKGREVHHSLTPYGRHFLAFIESFARL
ncbi:MAG: winged helix-turn-helix domain-containing protein [Patescibacteria group bacterium]|nr:winged helix-turn-helix domain-containing protein [Patescibacteria group bacterium]